MGARSGTNYLSSLRRLKAEVWIGGERVQDVTTHPAFLHCGRSIASLYDMQAEQPSVMTYRTDDGDRIGYSFVQPTDPDEVHKRSIMMKRWADFSGGMLGRTPDYLNSSLAAMASAEKFFAESEPRFGANVINYYRQARKFDWCATHTQVNPSASRGSGWAGEPDQDLALRVVRKTSDGILVSGARLLATLAPLCEELLVFPSTALKDEPQAEPFALAFAIPCNAPGLRFLCRESFDLARSHFDHPLASRFEEIDAVVIFSEVLIPWDRVFLCGDVARCNALYGDTDALVNMMHQVVVKDLAKAEFLLGLAARIAQASDAMGLQHVRERLAEMIMTTETMRACLRASEAEAARNRWGVFVPARAPLDAARNLFPRLYPRMVEIIQLNSSSALMAIPSEADFDSTIAPEIERYYAAAKANSRDRVALYRLAWDVACSSFGGRQILYERFFFGDPVRMASALVADTDLQPYIDRVNQLLSHSHS
jgi:4-hydroxyphenylacetate 3-monooxygenase